MNGAISDLNKAIELDEKFAVAYALRGQHLYWELSNKPKVNKVLEKLGSYSFVPNIYKLSHSILESI